MAIVIGLSSVTSKSVWIQSHKAGRKGRKSCTHTQSLRQRLKTWSCDWTDNWTLIGSPDTDKDPRRRLLPLRDLMTCAMGMSCCIDLLWAPCLAQLTLEHNPLGTKARTLITKVNGMPSFSAQIKLKVSTFCFSSHALPWKQKIDTVLIKPRSLELWQRCQLHCWRLERLQKLVNEDYDTGTHGRCYDHFVRAVTQSNVASTLKSFVVELTDLVEIRGRGKGNVWSGTDRVYFVGSERLVLHRGTLVNQNKSRDKLKGWFIVQSYV
ncbi:hypothetical protein RRG08_051628 [Elysia crispata]|uniref:Uncharacterized protein n=1 Tax=Elysia crispata TaxID=231223 RepID=A0AAE1DRZ9_9GAST|nr:hypothetical protein RRG08_051628 [Elysia crispata]